MIVQITVEKAQSFEWIAEHIVEFRFLTLLEPDTMIAENKQIILLRDYATMATLTSMGWA